MFALFLNIPKSSAQVTLPHYDGFNYPATQSLVTQSSWVLNQTATADLLITAGSLNYPGLPNSTGNKVAYVSGGEDAIKLFTQINSGTVYYSHLINITDMTSFTGGYCAGLIPNAAATAPPATAPGSGSIGAPVYVRPSVNTGFFNIGFAARANQAVQYGIVDYPLGIPVFVVASYEFVSGTNNDICKLWVNPIPGQVEPAFTFTATTTTDIANISGFYIRQNGSTSTPSVQIDELRITQNWSSATPIGWNGAEWSNTVGPTSVSDVIIAGAYSTSTNGAFSAKNVTINTGSLTINSGTNVTITDALVNTLTSADVVIENNANLIQNSAAIANANSGNITVKRTTNPLMLLDYVMWGSPVGNQQLQAFSPNTLSNRFYSYNSATNVYSAETATTNFVNGKGYLIRLPNDHPTTATAWTGSFVGVPNNGDYTFTPAVGFNSVANPYPSTLSMAQFVTDNPTITGTLHFWRKTNSLTVLPGYCSWNNGTYVSNGQPGSISDAVGNDMLQVGQGFIVNATATTGIVFKNSQRTSNNDNQTYKSASNALPQTAEKHRIWLNLTSANGGFSQTAFGYMSNATNEVDQYDGESFNDGNLSISSLISNQKYVIQGKALPFVTSDLVPLSYKVNQAGNYTIAIDAVDGLFLNNGQTVYLRDALLNTEINLSTSNYSFASEQGEFNNRFTIAYAATMLSNPDFSANSVVVFKNNNEIVINSGAIEMESVKIFDLRGSLLYDKNDINATTTSLSVDARNQVILIQVKDQDGKVVSKKMIN